MDWGIKTFWQRFNLAWLIYQTDASIDMHFFWAVIIFGVFYIKPPNPQIKMCSKFSRCTIHLLKKIAPFNWFKVSKMEHTWGITSVWTRKGDLHRLFPGHWLPLLSISYYCVFGQINVKFWKKFQCHGGGFGRGQDTSLQFPHSLWWGSLLWESYSFLKWVKSHKRVNGTPSSGLVLFKVHWLVLFIY